LSRVVDLVRANAPCGLRGCKNRPTPFPGQMSYKVTKPGLVLFYILACFNCIVGCRWRMWFSSNSQSQICLEKVSWRN